MKADAELAESANIDEKQLRATQRFLNMTYDAYVHGAYETTMELCDPVTGRFYVAGHPERSEREEFQEAVLLKLHEVVVAVEFTGAMTAHSSVFNAAREARRSMDMRQPWIANWLIPEV